MNDNKKLDELYGPNTDKFIASIISKDGLKQETITIEKTIYREITSALTSTRVIGNFIFGLLLLGAGIYKVYEGEQIGYTLIITSVFLLVGVFFTVSYILKQGFLCRRLAFTMMINRKLFMDMKETFGTDAVNAQLAKSADSASTIIIKARESLE